MTMASGGYVPTELDLLRFENQRLKRELEAAEAARPAPEARLRTIERRVIDAIFHEYGELTKEACEACEQCGPMVMCSFHSVLSLLSGGTSIREADGTWVTCPPADLQALTRAPAPQQVNEENTLARTGG